MGWVLRLVETGTDTRAQSVDVMEISRPNDLRDLASLGLTLSEAKQLLARVQQAVVAAQARDHADLRPDCAACGRRCHAKDWRPHRIAKGFGEVTVRLRRFRCSGCGRGETATGWPGHRRSTPELDQLRAHLSALLPCRVAAGLLEHLLPVAAGTSPEDGERHLEVRIGNVETPDGGRQVFGAVARTETDIVGLIRRNLETLGRTDATAPTAFTDGCPGLRSILTDAGVTSPPILDWFHVAMRLQHAKRAAEVLPTDEPGRLQAKAAIVEEVGRLRWRIWNGKAKDARLTIERIREVMPVFQGEHRHRGGNAPSRKLWHALHAVDAHLGGQSAWLVDYAERHRAGLRVGTSITEGTANFLVNRRMAKSRQMRWSRRGADLLLQVRSAVCDGTLGSGSGRLFEPMSHPHPALAKAA